MLAEVGQVLTLLVRLARLVARAAAARVQPLPTSATVLLARTISVVEVVVAVKVFRQVKVEMV
jgi:hypothetical protein